MPEINIPKAIKIKVATLADLTRLTITWALRHNPQALFYLEESGKHFLFTITTTLGYFELRGLPLVVYVELDKPPEGKFIAYTTDPNETITFKDTTEDRKFQYVPIVKLAERPAFF